MFDGLLLFQIPEKMGEFAVFIEHLEAKSVSLPPPRPGALPLDPDGGSAPRPPL